MREYTETERALIKAEFHAAAFAERMAALSDAVSDVLRMVRELGGQNADEIMSALREADYHVGTADGLACRSVRDAKAARLAAAPPVAKKASRRKVAA